MYNSPRNLILGFHGCDRQVAEELLADGHSFHYRKNPYDWLGHGMYFWEGNETRAREFANEKKHRGELTDPVVIGAVLDLGRNLNLLDSAHLQLVKASHEMMVAVHAEEGKSLPVNKGLLRHLDCAVVEFLHGENLGAGLPAFDSVRGMFPEGGELYEGAGFRDKNHIQICIRNTECILGLFRPRRGR